MKKFTSVKDVSDIDQLVKEAIALKKKPFQFQKLGQNKTLGLIFLNPSLRTRLSSQKAASNLGMNTIVMNIDKEGWALETKEGVVMNGKTVEHIKDAARVMGQYFDVLGIRSFPSLINRDEDYSEDILNKFTKYSGIPVISLESATLHPLQSLADLITIKENLPAGRQGWKSVKKPKVVLTWAPHVKALPQAVANSFSEWMCKADVDLTITHPDGYELSKQFTKGASVTHEQDKALAGADFVFVKNWSAYEDYGKILSDGKGWMLTNKKMALTNNGKVMHCLPVRRGVELSDELIDGKNSLIIEQASNRVYSAQVVLKNILESL